MTKPATLLDRDTVTTALYVAPFDTGQLAGLPAAQLREWVHRFAADPRSDITSLTAGLQAARQRGAGWVDPDRVAACERGARALFRYRPCGHDASPTATADPGGPTPPGQHRTPGSGTTPDLTWATGPQVDRDGPRVARAATGHAVANLADADTSQGRTGRTGRTQGDPSRMAMRDGSEVSTR